MKQFGLFVIVFTGVACLASLITGSYGMALLHGGLCAFNIYTHTKAYGPLFPKD